MRIFSYDIIKWFAAILPTIFTLFLLVKHFPYTGLGRVLSIPQTIILNTIIIVIGMSLTNKLTSLNKSVAWFGIILLTVLIAIALHPQEFLPNVFKQIWHKITS